MEKRIISYRGIELGRIISVEEQEVLLNKLEALLWNAGKMDLSKLPIMKIEVQNLIIDTQTKINKNSSINAPALLFFLGAYTSGIIGISKNETMGWLIGTVVAFVFMLVYIIRTNRIIDKYGEELLVYQNLDKLLDYIYFRNKRN